MDLSHIAKLLDEEYFQNPCFFYYLIMNKKV